MTSDDRGEGEGREIVGSSSGLPRNIGGGGGGVVRGPQLYSMLFLLATERERGGGR